MNRLRRLYIQRDTALLLLAVAVGALFALLPDGTPAGVRIGGMIASTLVALWAVRQLVDASHRETEREDILVEFQSLVDEGHKLQRKLYKLSTDHKASEAKQHYRGYLDKCAGWIASEFGPDEEASFRAAHDVDLAAGDIGGGYPHIAIIAHFRWLQDALSRFWEGKLTRTG